ncbi:defensin-B-like [Ochlerotatus camptorhynchus]|uniref:defensin-B-like n=1 Tax=Ochlerotatus camptorhynchus TaxID=644619 RepID=UPI0031D7635E
MKPITSLCIALVCFAVALSVGSAMPQASVATQDVQAANQDSDFEHAPQLKQIPLEFQRRKRITCDLLSGLGWGNSLCASHCMAISWRYRGGYCNSQGVCVCRS